MSAIYRTLKRLRASPCGDGADKAAWIRSAREEGFRNRLPLSGPGMIASVALIVMGALLLAGIHLAGTARISPGALADSPPSSYPSPGREEGVPLSDGPTVQQGKARMFRASFPGLETAPVSYACSLPVGGIGLEDPHGRSNGMGIENGVTTVLASAERPTGGAASEPVDGARRYAGEDVPEGYSPPDGEADDDSPRAVVQDDLSTEVRTDRSDGAGPESAGMPVTIHVDRVERPATVIRLVSRIERALALEDMAGAGALIDELAALKGTQDSYVLKLRAFWHMRQGDFDKASPLLLQVLERRPNDLEAGINMAIADINRGRFTSAKERLVELRERYPAHETVSKLIGQIGG